MKTKQEILEPITLSYWDSHQFANYLHEEGEYVKLEDAALAMEDYAAQFDFNKITDIRNHLLRHPDQDMIRAACRHYLGI